MTAKIPTWKEINDPDFELPDEIEVRRSPVKLLVHLLLGHAFFSVPILLLGLSTIYLVVGDPRASRAFLASVALFIFLAPLWGIPLFLLQRYIFGLKPSFILRRDGLFMSFIDGGYLLPWGRVCVVDYLGPSEIAIMRITVYVDPDEVSGTPPFGRLRMRRGLVNGLKKRHLSVPLIYKASARKLKALMRAYKKAAEEEGAHRSAV